MRTSVTNSRRLKRKRFGGRFGGYQGYKSKTWLHDSGVDGLMPMIEIELVWFIRSGWYYVVRLEGWWENKPLYECISNPLYQFRKGSQLEECAKAADEAAYSLLAKYGVQGVKLNQYKYTIYY